MNLRVRAHLRVPPLVSHLVPRDEVEDGAEHSVAVGAHPAQHREEVVPLVIEAAPVQRERRQLDAAGAADERRLGDVEEGPRVASERALEGGQRFARRLQRRGRTVRVRVERDAADADARDILRFHDEVFGGDDADLARRRHGEARALLVGA